MYFKFITFCTMAISLWSSILYAVEEIELLDKLDALREQVSDRGKINEGRYYILTLLINCEFDEGCILSKVATIQEDNKNLKNAILSGFVRHIKSKQKDLAYNDQNCKLDTKQAVRKVFAECYKQFMETEQKTPPKNRNEMDVIESDRYKCLNEKMAPLAKAGNIFAQAEMVNLSVYFRNDTATQRWYDLIKGRDDSKEYHQYLKCAEMP